MTSDQPISSAEFRRRLRWLIFHSWNIPPVFGLGFILLIGVLTPAQILTILSTPLEPAYILGWLAFAVWYLPRRMQPLCDWLDNKPGSSPAAAVRAVCRFPLLFWVTFLIYLIIAPASVIVAAEIYTDFVATLTDWFRIGLVALTVSIIVGLPIFFLVFDLFGQALGGLELKRPIISVRTKIFLIGALVPLLIDTMLVQYYWTRTGFFSLETFGVWLLLEALAIGGSLIFVHSFGQSLNPLQRLVGAPRPLPDASILALHSRSTDEIGMLTADYRRLLDELRLHSDILEINNRLLRSAGSEHGIAAVYTSVVELCRQAVDADQAFLIVRDPDSGILRGVAQTGLPYRPEGYYRLGLEDRSMAVAAFTLGQTIAIADAPSDPRVNPELRARFGILSALATPLRLGDELLGVLMVAHCQSRRDYSERDRALIEGLARETAIAVNTRQLRQAREQAESQQRQQAEQVRLLMDATEEGIYGVDGSETCTFINRAALRMLGFARPEELIGRSLHELIHHTRPDGRPYPKEQSQGWLALQAGETTHADDEVFWRADGTSFPVEYWLRPILREGKVDGAVVSFLDITQRKHAAEELRRYQQNLEKMVESRTQELQATNYELEAFSYSVSHDLRAPLRAIDGFSQALLEDYGDRLDSTGKNFLERVRAGAQNMGKLIDDLLKLSRVTRSKLQPEAIDLSGLARDVVEGLRAAEPDRAVRVDIAEGLRCRGDSGLMRILLQNLLENAWKYTRKTAAARISVDRAGSDEGAEGAEGTEGTFCISDNGVGFDMESAGKLFGAFQRLHLREEFEGTGIGLATVKRIVSRHGGQVWAVAEPGKGAAFFFTLTQEQASPEA